MNQLLKLKLKPVWVIAILGITVAGIAIPEARAVSRATETKPRVWNNSDCIKCHDNAETIRMMQDKRGDTTYCRAELEAAKKAGRLKAEHKGGY